MKKMQFIFFVSPNEELEHCTPKIWMYPKNEGNRVHVPADGKTCGHADNEIEIYLFIQYGQRHAAINHRDRHIVCDSEKD